MKWISKFWCIHRVKYHISYLNKLHTLTWALQCFTGFPDSSVGKESTCNAGDHSSIPGLGRSAGEGIGYPLQYSCASLWLSWWRIHLHCGRPGFNPWVGKIPGEEKGYPLQYSGLGNSMDYVVHGVAKSRTQLYEFHSLSAPEELSWCSINTSWMNE